MTQVFKGFLNRQVTGHKSVGPHNTAGSALLRGGVFECRPVNRSVRWCCCRGCFPLHYCLEGVLTLFSNVLAFKVETSTSGDSGLIVLPV